MAISVAIAAGGTAGHINPALALAEELSARGHKVCFYGQSTRLEASLVPEAGFDFFPIEVSGFNRRRPWTLLTALLRMKKAEAAIQAHFAEVGKPDVAIGFGAYVELPLLHSCKKLSIPTLIHEQNSVPGLANKSSAASARTVCVAIPAAISAFRDKVAAESQIVVTGNPVRSQVLLADRDQAREKLGIAEGEKLLLVFGGSLGARHINERIAGLKDKLLHDEKLHIVHSTGKDDFERTKELLNLSEAEQKRYSLMPYISNMGELLAAADVVLSRAGASSIAEIAARKVPSLLIPYPFATADHQTTNAKSLVEIGAAEMIADEAIDSEDFELKLDRLIHDEDLRRAMKRALVGLAQDKAQIMLADQVELAAGAQDA